MQDHSEHTPKQVTGQHSGQQSGHASSGGSFHGINADARILKITGWLTGIYFIIELGLGFYSQSIAVISDAFHTFSAVGGILIAFIANRVAGKAATIAATYGFKRAEIIGALLNGVFLLLMAIYVLYMGYMRLGKEFELPTNIMLLAAFGGLITEFVSFKLIFKSQKTNMNMKGAYWHIMQTFVGSILIIIAAVVIKLTGYTPIDAILGMAFGLVLFWASYKIIKDALDIFMQTVPEDVNISKVKEALLGIDGVKSVMHLHAWTLTSNQNIFSAHIQILDTRNSDKILRQAEGLLKDKFSFYFSTLQLETEHHDMGAEDLNVVT
ncbi:MAG: cation diffusion facilitator family transporter [Robiginitomaculum sp.]|nr:cation diffusion facilitator family transporter [Robiginitomaculum sp.]